MVWFFFVFYSGLFFDKYLKHIKLSEDFVQFTKINMSYLLKVSNIVHYCLTMVITISYSGQLR